MTSVVEACQQEGSVRSGDPQQLASFAWSTVHGPAVLLIDGQLEGDTARAMVMDLFVGLASDELRHQARRT